MTTEATMPTAKAPAVAEPSAAPGARGALILLLLINLFNYIDRQVLAAVEPEVCKEFFPDNPNSPEALTAMGTLASAFLVTYMLAAPLFGWLANRVSRWLLIGVGVGLWSLASGASGLATAYGVMLLTRCFVGIGEAVYGPVAPDLISDYYPIKRRGQVLAWFYAAIPFGGALGYAFGDAVVKLHGDWRMAFFLVVPPGLLLALCSWFMREPARGANAAVVGTTRRREHWTDYLILLKTPSYVLNTAGMTAMTFAIGGLAWWAPRYLEWRQAEPLFGVPPKTAFGALTALAGLAATLLGGWAGDRLQPRFSGSYFLVSGAAMLLACPLLLLMTFLSFPYAWGPLALFVFCLFFNTGPTNTILANVTHPLLRAPGFAFNILIIHILGDVVSPPLLGLISGLSNWDVAFRFVSFVVLIGGVLWLMGSRYLERDTALAPTRLPA